MSRNSKRTSIVTLLVILMLNVFVVNSVFADDDNPGHGDDGHGHGHKTPTAMPTATATATLTATATQTTMPTATTQPTSTSVFTATPAPTATPQPTATPVSTATPAPGTQQNVSIVIQINYAPSNDPFVVAAIPGAWNGWLGDLLKPTDPPCATATLNPPPHVPPVGSAVWNDVISWVPIVSTGCNFDFGVHLTNTYISIESAEGSTGPGVHCAVQQGPGGWVACSGFTNKPVRIRITLNGTNHNGFSDVAQVREVSSNSSHDWEILQQWEINLFIPLVYQ